MYLDLLLSFMDTLRLFPTDSSLSINLSEKQRECQSLLMLHTIRGLPQYEELGASYEENLEEFRVVDDPCKWQGVICRSKAVYGIRWTWNSNRDGEIQVQWLPNSVCTVYISDRCIDAPFNTRMMPLQAVVFSMERCALRGSIDMENLPPYLDHFSLAENILSGSIVLRKLPASITEIFLQKNAIEYVFVDNSKLPKSLQTVKLKSRAKKLAVKVVNPKRLDKRICLR